MLKTSLQIWLTTNIVMAVILLFYFGFENSNEPSARMVGVITLFALGLSLPVVPLMTLFFTMIKSSGCHLKNSWALYILSVVVFTQIPMILLALWFRVRVDVLMEELLPFLIIALISAYLSSLINCTSLHNLFKSISHEK